MSLPESFEIIWIQTNQALASVCESIQRAASTLSSSVKSAVALDTEFIRTRTFYPQLGLIQLYAGESVYLIDPLEIKDFAPLIELFKNPNVIKVLHACSEDLEVFQHYFQCQPQPMVDTQIMASFLGLPNSSGFASLISHYFDKTLDKGASRTDWLARPLTEKQLHYAAIDVAYLLPLYEKMQRDLQQTAWQSAVDEECDYLIDKASRVLNDDEAYLNIANAWRLEGVKLLSLKLLAQWRLQIAQSRNLAINFVVKEQALWSAADRQVKHTAELLALDWHPNEIRRYGKKVIQLIAQANKMEIDSYPNTIIPVSESPNYREKFKLLQQHLRKVCPTTIAKEQLASRKLINQLIKWLWLQSSETVVSKKPRLLIGWRQPYGEQLLEELKTHSLL